MENEVKSALITGATIAVACAITIPIGLNIYEKGIKPVLENEKKSKQKSVTTRPR